MAALTLERSRCNARVSSVLINLGMVFHSETLLTYHGMQSFKGFMDKQDFVFVLAFIRAKFCRVIGSIAFCSIIEFYVRKSNAQDSNVMPQHHIVAPIVYLKYTR